MRSIDEMMALYDIDAQEGVQRPCRGLCGHPASTPDGYCRRCQDEIEWLEQCGPQQHRPTRPRWQRVLLIVAFLAVYGLICWDLAVRLGR